MAQTGAMARAVEHEPLISNGLLTKIIAGLSVMALLTTGTVLGGEWLGKRIRLGGNTDSTEGFLITIGQDKLSLPANMIRFETERRSGAAERVDLNLTWPSLEGFSRANSDRFNDLSKAKGLIFVQLSQAVMSRDMSGRIGPIYSHLFDGAAVEVGHGLSMHRFKAQAGYERDVLLTAKRNDKDDYAVRCVLPANAEQSTSADCQRDFSAGKDLSVLYRFSSDLLPQWQELDAAVAQFVAAHLTEKTGEIP